MTKTDTAATALRALVETCSYCNQSLKGNNKDFRLVKTKKEFKDKPVYEVVCTDPHPGKRYEFPSILVALTDTGNGWTEIAANDKELK